MLNREDVERIVHNYVRENLKIEINGDYSSPNKRRVAVMLGTEQICVEHFDVVQRPEYES